MKIAFLTETAKLPTRKHALDAGLDLFVDSPIHPIEIYSGEIEIVHTGITVEIPQGYFGWITNKSSKDYLIGGGIVDEGYQGELLVKVINPTSKVFILNHHDAVAQFLIIPVKILDINIVPLKDIHNKKSDRNIDGGISTQLHLQPPPLVTWESPDDYQLEGIGDMPIIEEDNYNYTEDDFNYDRAREAGMRRYYRD